MSHSHNICIRNALQQAEALCQSRKAALTPARRNVLELVWQTHQPIKAYELLAQMQVRDPSAKPPTVYRALEFLEAQGLVHKVQSLSAYMGCPHPEHREPCLLLLCESCGEVAEASHPLLAQALTHTLQQAAFAPKHHVLEISGMCRTCH